jgi:hypothetical protein
MGICALPVRLLFRIGNRPMWPGDLFAFRRIPILGREIHTPKPGIRICKLKPNFEHIFPGVPLKNDAALNFRSDFRVHKEDWFFWIDLCLQEHASAMRVDGDCPGTFSKYLAGQIQADYGYWKINCHSRAAALAEGAWLRANRVCGRWFQIINRRHSFCPRRLHYYEPPARRRNSARISFSKLAAAVSEYSAIRSCCTRAVF